MKSSTGFPFKEPAVTIRPMTIKDYPEAYSLWTGTAGMGLRSKDDSPEGIARFLNRNPGTSFVCRNESGALTGIILCGHDGRRGYIYHAAVAEGNRHQGVGRRLVEAVLEALQKEEIKKVALVAYRNNHRGNAFWQSLGFTLREDLHYRNLSLDADNE